MITVKCTYANGDYIETEINATLEEAQKYFLNKCFNLGTGADGEPEDNLQKCVAVEEVEGVA